MYNKGVRGSHESKMRKEGRKLRKAKLTFEQLVRENKQKLLSDRQALDALEERLEKKLEKRFLEKLS